MSAAASPPHQPHYGVAPGQFVPSPSANSLTSLRGQQPANPQQNGWLQPQSNESTLRRQGTQYTQATQHSVYSQDSYSEPDKRASYPEGALERNAQSGYTGRNFGLSVRITDGVIDYILSLCVRCIPNYVKLPLSDLSNSPVREQPQHPSGATSGNAHRSYPGSSTARNGSIDATNVSTIDFTALSLNDQNHDQPTPLIRQRQYSQPLPVPTQSYSHHPPPPTPAQLIAADYQRSHSRQARHPPNRAMSVNSNFSDSQLTQGAGQPSNQQSFDEVYHNSRDSDGLQYEHAAGPPSTSSVPYGTPQEAGAGYDPQYGPHNGYDSHGHIYDPHGQQRSSGYGSPENAKLFVDPHTGQQYPYPPGQYDQHAQYGYGGPVPGPSNQPYQPYPVQHQGNVGQWGDPYAAGGALTNAYGMQGYPQPGFDPYQGHGSGAPGSGAGSEAHRMVSGASSMSSLQHPSLNRNRTTTSGKTSTSAASASERDKPPITKVAVDEYRNRIKNDMDAETQFNFARFLIEAARRLAVAEKQGTMSKDEDFKSVKKYRDSLLQEALKLIKRLATQGNGLGKPAYADAQFFLANCLGHGALGLAIDHEKAYNLYVQASKQNHPAATYRTAVCNEVGAGTRRDPARAVLFYRKASALGDTAGMYKLGMILLNGLLAQPKNPREAVMWLKKAAAQADEENPHALHELGVLYEKQQEFTTNGQPVPAPVIRDEAQAREFYTQAAQLGYPPSQYKMGSSYEYGVLTCPVDPRRSIAWYSVRGNVL